MSNIFELATRQNLTFPSSRGELTLQQLWDLPLTSRTSFDLDEVAKVVNAQLQAESKESFVKVKQSTKKVQLETKLAILKHIIEVKQHEAKQAQEAAGKGQERQKILAILETKRDQELANLSPEELEKRLADLG